MLIQHLKKILIVSALFPLLTFLMAEAGQRSALKTAADAKHTFIESRYGIKGQRAPELNLTTWIDENGKKMAPIRLSSLKGKVVYLFFFQSW